MKKLKITPEELVAALDLPHRRHANGKWMKTGSDKPEFSKHRLEFYAKKLLDLGMRKEDVSCLLSDLYWDSFEEAKLNKIL